MVSLGDLEDIKTRKTLFILSIIWGNHPVYQSSLNRARFGRGWQTIYKTANQPCKLVHCFEVLWNITKPIYKSTISFHCQNFTVLVFFIVERCVSEDFREEVQWFGCFAIEFASLHNLPKVCTYVFFVF